MRLFIKFKNDLFNVEVSQNLSIEERKATKRKIAENFAGIETMVFEDECANCLCKLEDCQCA